MAKRPKPEPEPLLGLTVRLPESIVHRLQDAAHERKKARGPEPRTQAGIVAAALDRWLRDNGF